MQQAKNKMFQEDTKVIRCRNAKQFTIQLIGTFQPLLNLETLILTCFTDQTKPENYKKLNRGVKIERMV